MFHKLWLPSLLVLFATALLIPAVAQEQKKPQGEESSTRVPVDYLISAAKSQMQAIDGNKKFAKKANARAARVLAVLAQAIAESDEDAPLRKSAPALREAALTLAKAENEADAKKALEGMKMLKADSEVTAAKDYDWSKLIDAHTLMEEVQSRNAKIGKVVRTGAKDPEAGEHAVVLSALGTALRKNPNGLKDQKDIDLWVSSAGACETGFAKLRVALEAGDAAKAKTIFAEIGKSCTACHEKFRKD